MTSTKRNSANTNPGALYDMPGHLIRRCQQIAVALFFEECGAFEITPQQYAVLSVLADNDGVDQITLAGLAALNRTTAGEIVDRMVSAGLLERRDNPLDRRVKKIFLTELGLKLLGDMHEAVLRVQQRLLQPLDPAERETFIALLARIASENNELSRAPLRAMQKRQHKSTARSVESD
jgi:MarR family transcriptional regulator, lower aerobic nicotinate degradation pathway regulator